MSQKIQTFCDVCREEFTGSYWDDAPCHVVLSMGAPAQSYESHDLKHVCRPCRQAISAACRPKAKVVVRNA